MSRIFFNEGISATIDLVVEVRSSYAEDREPIQSPAAPTRPSFGGVASNSVPSVISTLWLTPPEGGHTGPKTRLPSGTYSSFGLPSAESQSTDCGSKFEGDMHPDPPSAISTLYLTPPSPQQPIVLTRPPSPARSSLRVSSIANESTDPDDEVEGEVHRALELVRFDGHAPTEDEDAWFLYERIEKWVRQQNAIYYGPLTEMPEVSFDRERMQKPLHRARPVADLRNGSKQEVTKKTPVHHFDDFSGVWQSGEGSLSLSMFPLSGGEVCEEQLLMEIEDSQETIVVDGIPSPSLPRPPHKKPVSKSKLNAAGKKITRIVRRVARRVLSREK